jgi:hypothetical protein
MLSVGTNITAIVVVTVKIRASDPMEIIPAIRGTSIYLTQFCLPKI